MRTIAALCILAAVSANPAAAGQADTVRDERVLTHHFLDRLPLERVTPRAVRPKPHKAARKPKAAVATPVAQERPVDDDGRLVEKVDILARYALSLLRPIGNCQAFDTVDARVKVVVSDAAKHFGKPALISSCYRPLAYNRRVGGAKRSQHIARKALDFKIAGVSPRELGRYIRQHPIMKKIGGVGVYAWGVHADVGPKRNWGIGGGKVYAHRSRARA